MENLLPAVIGRGPRGRGVARARRTRGLGSVVGSGSDDRPRARQRPGRARRDAALRARTPQRAAEREVSRAPHPRRPRARRPRRSDRPWGRPGQPPGRRGRRSAQASGHPRVQGAARRRHAHGGAPGSSAATGTWTSSLLGPWRAWSSPSSPCGAVATTWCPAGESADAIRAALGPERAAHAPDVPRRVPCAPRAAGRQGAAAGLAPVPRRPLPPADDDRVDGADARRSPTPRRAAADHRPPDEHERRRRRRVVVGPAPRRAHGALRGWSRRPARAGRAAIGVWASPCWPVRSASSRSSPCSPPWASCWPWTVRGWRASASARVGAGEEPWHSSRASSSPLPPSARPAGMVRSRPVVVAACTDALRRRAPRWPGPSVGRGHAV